MRNTCSYKGARSGRTKKQDKYAKSQRLRATTSLTKYVNQQGHVTTSFLDIFENLYI